MTLTDLVMSGLATAVTGPDAVKLYEITGEGVAALEAGLCQRQS